MAARRDAVIIGAGHNGLVTAFYLARAGFHPLVLERADKVGGAAITDEFHPGFRCPTLAHTPGPLRANVVRDMQLLETGLKFTTPEPRVLALSPNGRPLPLYRDAAQTAAAVAPTSEKDARGYIEFQRALNQIAGVVADVLAQIPPDINDPGASDLFALIKTGQRVRKLGAADMYRLLRWAPMAIADLVAEFFETELLRAAIAAHGIFGTALGPWSAGSALVLLLRAGAEFAADGVATLTGPSAAPLGGMGALTETMVAAARNAGAEVRTHAEVERVMVQDGAAIGVVLKSGEEIPASIVISSADPKRTLLGFVGPEHLGPELLGRIQNYRSNGTLAKVNLALDRLPAFTGVRPQETTTLLSGRIHIGPDIDYLERAFDASKYGDFSRAPYLEVMIPTISDPSLAPASKHLMSIYAQFAPYRLRSGDWPSQEQALGDAVVATLAQYAPELPKVILAGQVITPLELERKYGLTGGHPFHGELALDQVFTMRPLLEWSRYRTPIRNLFMCGSGTHPGIGLTGASGANAAREILRAMGRKARTA
jgi:phytoene dehydrogenase-like protein